MFKHPIGMRPGGTRHRAATTASLLACVAGVLTLASGAAGLSQAQAAEPYGEVTRFGGPVKEFAANAISAQDEGKFVLPVGFAVEPENALHEKNVVYVLDRILSDTATGELDYRLQEISSTTHQVLGATTITEKYTNKTSYSEVHPLVGLAVSDKRVYTIVESMVNTQGTTYVPVAGRLVAWSTEPEPSTKRLVRAEPSEFPEDGITGASVVANESAFKVSGGLSELLYEPCGLAADAVTGNVAIEAQAGVTAPATPGHTTVQLVYTTGIDRGQLGARWTDSHAMGEGGEWNGNGLFAGDNEDEFGVDQFTKAEEAADLSSVNVGSGSATAIAPSTAGDNDEVVSTVGESPIGGQKLAGEFAFNEVIAAGTPVVRLSSNVYAGLFAQPDSGEPKNDFQGAIAPWLVEENGSEITPEAFWIQGNSSGATAGLGNLGVRLFEANGNVVDTIGGGTPNDGAPTGDSELGSCNIDFRRASLAVGSEGAIFVLTQPRAEGKKANYEYDDQVIEFAPGGQYKCPELKDGSVEVRQNAGEAWKELQKGAEPEPSVSLDEGTPVSFSALSLDQPTRNLKWAFKTYTFEWSLIYEWTPFAFEWNLEGATSGGASGEGYTIVNKTEESNGYEWPTPEVDNYIYKDAGIYHAALRVYGALGTKTYPFIVHVLGSAAPQAGFAVPGSITAGVPVTFDGATESKPTPGTEVEYYEWSFGGEGEAPTTTTEAQIEHTFATPGKYEVTLVIHDKAGSVLVSKAAEHEVTVAPAQTTTTTTTTSDTTSNTSTTHTSGTVTTTTTTTKTSSTSKSKKAPTKKELLAKALKACHKDKAKKKRAACERQAKKKYGSKPKPKKSKKK